MAFRFVSRALVSNSSLASRSSSSVFAASSPHVCARPSLSVFSLLRPLSAAVLPSSSPAASGLRHFSTRQTTSSLNDPSPNWSNRPPKETILLDGCDFEHWLCVMEPPEGDPTRDEIIDSYIKTLATVVGSEEEARMKIYSVSTKCYFAFGALVSEDVSLKIKELPKVRWVLPDSYLDVKNKDYGGEPFINGQAVPYDPKYHEEWIRNNNRANERNRRNDRPRNFDRSRNFERRQQNVQTQPPMHNQNSNAPPMHNQNSNAPPMNNQSSNFAPSNQNFMRPMQNHMAPPQSQAQNSPVPPMHNQNINFVPPTQNMQSMPNRMGPPLNNNMPPPPSHMPNNNMPPPQMPNNSMRPPQMPNNNMPPPQMPNNNMPPPQMPNNNMPPPQMPNNNMPPPHMQYNHTPPPHLQNMSNPMSPQGQQQQNIPPVPNTSPNSGWPSNMAGPGSSIQNNAGWSGSGRE